MKQERPFDDLDEIARRLGLPATWLRAEADAGRVPYIKAGRKRLAHVADVERVLRDRAVSEPQEQPA